MRYIAVILRESGVSQRRDGSWACFDGTDKKALISKAIKARDLWEKEGAGPYRILIGVIQEEVISPVRNYELMKFEDLSDILASKYTDCGRPAGSPYEGQG